MNERMGGLCIRDCVRDRRRCFCYQAAVMAGKSGNKSGNDHQNEGERVAKAIARAGLASRREAEAWIAAGRVVVNGEKITSPARNVTPADRVIVDGKPLPVRERTRLFLFNKPRGRVTTHSDPQGRPTVFDALPKHLPRLISVGRLDANTEGLLLLTNDGGLARLLELPATGWTRRYRVRANGKITQLRLDRLRHGIEIDGVRYGPIEARLDREQGANVWLTFAMREGKNREVKNVLGHLGLAVNRLIRVSFGPFQLGELGEGAVEEVRTRHLREQLGERIATAAGLDFAGPVEDQSRESAARAQPRAPASPRHPEARATSAVTRASDALRRASKGDGPDRRSTEDRRRKRDDRQPPASAGRPSLEGRGRTRPPQDDGARDARAARSNKKPRRHGPDSVGEPEKARRERKHGKRPFRGKPR
jgi:23S rRNA pseudouridine2605 synthase